MKTLSLQEQLLKAEVIYLADITAASSNDEYADFEVPDDLMW